MTKAINETAITKYTVIDQIGSIDDDVIRSLAWKRAYKLTSNPKETYTLSGVIRESNGWSKNATVSQKSKSYFRNNLIPDQVIVIVRYVTKYNKWIIDTWAEKVDDLVVIEAEYGDVLTFNEYKPGIFSQKDWEMNRLRRMALIWARPLGWYFDRPIVLDPLPNDITGRQARPDRKKMIELQGSSDHVSKIASSPESYRLSKSVVSEEELKAFAQHYTMLYRRGELADDLDIDYTLCPRCGRPVRTVRSIYEDTQCNYCDTIIDEYAPFIDTYYEDNSEFNDVDDSAFIAKFFDDAENDEFLAILEDEEF